MTDLSKPWPLGLSGQNWIFRFVIFVAAIGLISTVDAQSSKIIENAFKPARGVFEAITRYGETDWILIPALALMVISGGLALIMPKWTPKMALVQNAQLFAFIFIAIGLPGLTATTLKRLIGRGRPGVYEAAGPFDFSPNVSDYLHQAFPSGHATTGLGLAVVVGFLAPRYFPLALVFGLAIALSRVVVGAHSVTDILAGAVLGTLGAYAVRNVFAARRWVFENKDGRIVMRPVGAIIRLVRGRQRAAR
jgi:membrane-associated phospholipid phosphatase